MDSNNDFMTYWLKMDDIQSIVKKELEGVLQYEYHLSLKEFYVLYYLSIAPDKKLRLQELQKLILDELNCRLWKVLLFDFRMNR